MCNSCNYDLEKELLDHSYRYICGIDEVGRGAIFGPVVAGAVILNPQKQSTQIKDSKKLTHRQRVQLSTFIYKNSLAYSIGWCWNDEIDAINILKATKKSMKMAINRLQIFPDYVLLDGMEPDFIDIKGRGIINGDNKSLSIAAASIIAKVFRDQLLISFSKFFPEYQFHKNKGYPTKEHIYAVALEGMTEYHRKSFRINNGSR